MKFQALTTFFFPQPNLQLQASTHSQSEHRSWSLTRLIYTFWETRLHLSARQGTHVGHTSYRKSFAHQGHCSKRLTTVHPPKTSPCHLLSTFEQLHYYTHYAEVTILQRRAGSSCIFIPQKAIHILSPVKYRRRSSSFLVSSPPGICSKL